MNRWTDQMYDHKVDVVHGPPTSHRLEYFAKIGEGETYNRGACVSADSNGFIVAGCAAGTVGNRPMPMIALQGSADLDVYTDQYNGGDAVGSALACTGGYEVATTEFVKVSEGSPVAYAVNDLLTCDASGNFTKAGVDAGGASVPICGVVSVATNGIARINALGTKTSSNYDVPLLTFWTAYLPCAGSAQ